jgi:DNA-binding transcriptional MerR regulator
VDSSNHSSSSPRAPLPPIPAKRYFTIGEVSELCGVKPHVLRYWEQEFTQLKPVKRRGNRRYYQHHEVLLIRRIRELLYEQGFTISGARARLDESAAQTKLAASSKFNPAILRREIQSLLDVLHE